MIRVLTEGELFEDFRGYFAAQFVVDCDGRIESLILIEPRECRSKVGLSRRWAWNLGPTFFDKASGTFNVGARANHTKADHSRSVLAVYVVRAVVGDPKANVDVSARAKIQFWFVKEINLHLSKD
jgi:hypothetical protein